MIPADVQKASLDELEETAEDMVQEEGLAPPMHLSGEVAPSGVFHINERKLDSENEKEEIMEKFDIPQHYPFVEFQVEDVPIDVWAEEADIEYPYLLYLSINSMTDMHNAVSSALDIVSDRELTEYLDVGNPASLDYDIEKVLDYWRKGVFDLVGREKGDYYHFWRGESDEKKREMARELMADIVGHDKKQKQLDEVT